MSIFTELKRRNVFKVGVAYLVVAWLLLQLLAILLPVFAAPAWVMRVAVAFLALGFIVSLFIAWAFELTPDGIKPTNVVPEDESIRPQTGQKLNRLIISGLSLALVLVVVDAYVLPDNPAPVSAPATTVNALQTEVLDTIGARTGSIAVLPFTNLSNDPDQEYFSDGLTEELINKLSQVEDLLVTGRNSSFYFKHRDEDLFEIGRLLGVEHILQGSVRKSGSQLRITAQLLAVENNANLWSQTFDRELDDIFSIQDEIAGAVTTALSVTLGAGEFSLPGRTMNAEAWNEYQQASRLAIEFTPTSVQQALEHFERALALDPDFALAYLSKSALLRLAWNVLPPDDVRGFEEDSELAYARAVALAPDMPELYGRRLEAAATWADLERVLLEILAEGGDTDAAVVSDYGMFLANVGQGEAALRYLQQARRLDPYDPMISFLLTQGLLIQGRTDDALEEVERGIALEGFDQFLAGVRFMVAIENDDAAAALSALERMPNPSSEQQEVARLWLEGQEALALEQVRAVFGSDNIPNALRAVYMQFFLALGEYEPVLDWAIETKGGGYTIWLPMFTEARQDPKFRELLEVVGLVDYWRSTGNWGDFCKPTAGNDDYECF